MAVGLVPCARADIVWPTSARTVGEVGDLVRHIVAIAPRRGIEGKVLLSPDAVAAFYRQRDFVPAWIDTGGVSLAAADVLVRLRLAAVDGLDPGRYHLALIEERMARARDAVELAQLDLLLTDAYLTYGRELQIGRLDPASADPGWRLAREPSDEILTLQHGLQRQNPAQALMAMAPPHEDYKRLRLALVRYLAVARRGGWESLPKNGPVLRKGMRDPRVVILRERLLMDGDLREEPEFEEFLFEDALEVAVRGFQRRHGLMPTGVVDDATRQAMNVPVEQRIRQIAVNMERWRWLSRSWPERYIAVNLPGFELRLWEQKRPVFSTRVIVGRDQRQTPVLASRISTLVLNPFWYVPETVLRQDLLPALQRDPSVLTRMRLRVLRDVQDGQEVDPAKIRWDAYTMGKAFPYVLRQEPGPGNMLGRIKFVLQDTPAIAAPEAFSRRSLALSSGCIRVEEPLALARRLLGPGAQATLNEHLATATPQFIELAEPIPVFLLYFTAWVDERNALHFGNDIYGRDARMAAMLTRTN